MTRYRITAIHSSALDDDEVRRRLSRVYQMILNCQPKVQERDDQDTPEQPRGTDPEQEHSEVQP